MKQFENVFETMAGGKNGNNVIVGPQKRPQRVKQKVVNGYTYNDAKGSGNWDLDRIRTYLKTEINEAFNGDPEQVFYSVDVGDTKKDGKFYALKCHMGRLKQVTIKKAYTVDELAAYFFGPMSGSDFHAYNQTPQTWAQRKAIWDRFYTRSAWAARYNQHVQQAVASPVQGKANQQTQTPVKVNKPVSNNIFDQILNEQQVKPKKSPEEIEKQRIQYELQKYNKDLLKGIVAQITHGCLYSNPHTNGAEAVLDSIDDKYLSQEIKSKILDIGNIENELDIMIIKATERVGKTMEVYEAGQMRDSGDVYEEWISTNKDLVIERVKEAISDMCEMSKDDDELIKSLGYLTFDEFKKAEMGKIYYEKIF